MVNTKINLPGIIQIMLPGTPFEEVERCREIIHTLFESDFFKVKNGKAMVHFDHQGTVQLIGIDAINWKRDKSLQKIPPGDIIKVQSNTQTHTLSGPAK